MAFTKKFSEDPLRNRVYLLVHSEPKVGKTKMVLDLVRKHGDYVILFSFDEGTFEVRQTPEVFESKLAIAKPTSLKQLRDDMHEGSMLIERLVKAGVKRWRIWAVIDTVTHMQNRLMVEARQINVKNPDARDVRRDFVRDATTEVDFNINLAHMSEVANYLSSLPCNVIALALSKEEYVERRKTGRVLPAITGQSGLRFSGDADAILYLNRNDKGDRWLECDAETGGDRSGALDRKESADLMSVATKMIGRNRSDSAVSDADPKPKASVDPVDPAHPVTKAVEPAPAKVLTETASGKNESVT
jgi:hypothetical protein